MARHQVNPERQLSPYHRADLRKSGLSNETIRSMGVYTADRWEIRDIVHFPTRTGGLVIPYYVQNRVVVGYEVKPNKPHVFTNGDVAKYISPRREPIHLYVPPRLTLKRLQDPTETLYIPEGAKKAGKMEQEGFKAIGIRGVDAWRQKGVPLPEWALVNLKGCLVIIVFDSDLADKPDVQRALRAFAAWLRSQGAIVYALHLPHHHGEKLGADEALVHFGRAWLRNLPLHEVPPPEPPAEPQPISETERAIATFFWRGIGQEGELTLGHRVSSSLGKHRYVPSTTLVHDGSRIRVAVDEKGKKPWPLAVAWSNLGLGQQKHAKKLEELSKQNLVLVDQFLRRIAPEGFHERDSDEETYFALWSTFLDIYQQRYPHKGYPVKLKFHLTVLRALGLSSWNEERIIAAWKIIVDHERVEEDHETFKDGKPHPVYRLATPLDFNPFGLIDNMKEETGDNRETNDRSPINDLAPTCPCGCPETLGLGRDGKPKKWADSGCKQRFYRKNQRA